MDLGMDRETSARHIGVNTATIHKWELCRVQPNLRYFPATFAFLECSPFKDARSFRELVRAKHLEIGWFQDDLAKYLGVCGSTIGEWESSNPLSPMTDSASSSVSWAAAAHAGRSCAPGVFDSGAPQ